MYTRGIFGLVNLTCLTIDSNKKITNLNRLISLEILHAKNICRIDDRVSCRP